MRLKDTIKVKQRNGDVKLQISLLDIFKLVFGGNLYLGDTVTVHNVSKYSSVGHYGHISIVSLWRRTF